MLLGLAAAGALALGSRAELGGPEVFRWITYANTVLAASTVLYAAYLWLPSEAPVGRAASGLAAGGAAGVLATLLLGLATGADRGPGLHEGTSLFAAAAVIAYLALERTYGTRSAGIVVMSVVMVAVLCEMWMIRNGLTGAGALRAGFAGYWIEGHRLAVCLGYCPVVAAAAMVPLETRQALPTARRAMLAAVWLGAPLLLLGAGMGMIGLLMSRDAGISAYNALAFVALSAPLAIAARMTARGADDPRLAWHALAIFVVSTAGLARFAWVAGDPL